MKNSILLFALCLIAGSAGAQIVNAYAKVNNITGSTIHISDVNQAYGKFEVGKEVLIMQMQDKLIQAPSNSENSGRTNNMKMAGLYEIATISSIQRSGTIPISITLTEQLDNNFNTSNASLQVVSYPELGTPHYNTESAMTGLPWNGKIGGVVAFKVAGNLTLRHNISATGIGFRGGAKSNWSDGYFEFLFGWIPIWRENPPLQPSPNTYFTEDNTGAYAEKGEGISTPNGNLSRKGRGALGTGGGGGNQNNAGGGGGSNFTAGGEGGNGYQTSNANASGGKGGQQLENHISASRVFMGGGGGGGQGNDNTATDGAAGGGIVMIMANRIITEGSNPNLEISANGSNAQNAQKDGAGGGGAGGSIILHANFWQLSPSTNLRVEANGGNGGGVSSSNAHGAGAGGGQGTVIFPFSQPAAGITVTTKNGNGGCNNGPCTSSAGNGAGQPNQGIIEFSVGPLPITLLTFEAVKAGSGVKLLWETASEINNDYFAIERSADMDQWQVLLTEAGAGFSTSLLQYESFDHNPLSGMNYYRLRQVDYNGDNTLSEVQAVNFTEGPGALEADIFPNPATTVININHPELSRFKILLYDAAGQLIEVFSSSYYQSLAIKTGSLESGTYFVILVDQQTSETYKVVVEK